MACPAIGSKSRPPTLRIGALLSSGRRTKRSSPNNPANMLPFTNAARLPNIGRMVTAGSAGTSLVKAALACSLGLGIMPGPIRLMFEAYQTTQLACIIIATGASPSSSVQDSLDRTEASRLRQVCLTYCKAIFTLHPRHERAAAQPGSNRGAHRAAVHASCLAVPAD